MMPTIPEGAALRGGPSRDHAGPSGGHIGPPLRVAAILALVFALPLSADSLRLHTRQTRDLKLVYYDKAHEYLTYHLVRSFENSLETHRRLFGYEPSEPVLVLMQDFGDYGHGGTSTVPWNYMSIGIAPFDYVYDTMPANERMNWLMHHELVHVVATDKGADSDLRYRALFRGKVTPIKENPMSMLYSYLTSPRWYSPRWYHEGIAVFLETWMAGGVGRVLGGYDEMVFRTMVLEDAYFYDVVGLESEGTTIDFQVGQNSYLYGTRFVTYLAMKYGPVKVLQWFNRTSGSKRYFSAQFREVYGVSLDEEWKRWIEWEHQWQRENLARIREFPVTKETPILSETLGSVSRSYFDAERGFIYAAINRPAKPAQIVSIDTASGKITKLAEVSAPALYFVTSLAHDAKGRKLFFTTDNTRGWRDINELDLANGRRRVLLKNARTGDLVVNPGDQSLWGMQHHNGYSTLVRIAPPYDKWKTIMTLEYGRDLFDIDISPDGKKLSGSIIDVGGRQQLVLLDVDRLISGDSRFEVLHEFANNTPANFVFSPDGRHLYGTSYYTGVSNVFRYDLQEKKIEAITNVESGVFRPLPVANDRLIAYKYSARGFVPVSMPISTTDDVNAIHYLGQEVVEKHSVVKEWIAGSPARIDLDKVTTYTGDYEPMREMRLASMYPILEGYKDAVAVGVRFNLADPLALHAINVTAAYSEDDDLDDDEKLHLKVAYDHAPWKVSLRYNATDFYDLFGPTKTSRKGHSASVTFHEFLVYERPRTFDYSITAAFYGGLDTLPDYQNVRAPFEEYSTLRASLDFSDLRRTLGAVEPEKGRKWSLVAAGSYVNDEFFPRVHASYDHGFILPIEHSSLWLRGAAGKSWGDEENAFARFFFGGFGNNWIDYQDERRYREFYAFPGLELNEVGGTEFAKGTVEWTLPPMRFRRVGIPGLYANWSRLALFVSELYTDSRSMTSVGGQLDVSVVLFSSLDSTLSFGYAVADSEDEFMVSLKLLK